MTDEEAQHIINYAKIRGYLISVCLGCGLPYTKEIANIAGFDDICHDCPAGSQIIWNPRIVKLFKKP